MGKRSDRRAEAEKRDRLLHLLLIIMTIYDQWMMGISGGGEKEGDAMPALDMRACEAAWAKRQLARVTAAWRSVSSFWAIMAVIA